jgi:predicted N-acyltransferase
VGEIAAPEDAAPGEHRRARAFSGFEDFLSCFNKNQRKNIRREYRRHEEQVIELRIVENPPEAYFDAMYDLYTITNDKFVPWDARWVNGDFFHRIAAEFSRRAVFSRASRAGKILALAMMIRKGGKIWGRYWGAYEEVRDLHFAACYYAPIEYCIREGIQYFDPGIGSSHKIRRGFRAALGRSWHRFFDPVLEALFKSNIDKVNRYERDTVAKMNEEIPYRAAPRHR